ncbi:MAG: hypothetical protein RLZZ500_1176 [Bacteroidota bacterium]|jgi:signal transduction histidine kinase
MIQKRISIGWSPFCLVFFLFLGIQMQAQDVNAVIDKLKTELQAKPDTKRTAVIYSDLTWYYSNVSTDSALVYGGKALREAQKLGDSTLIAQVYSDVGAVYFRKGNFQESKENYVKCLKIRKARKDAKGIAKVQNNLGNIYERTFEYKKSMESFLEALAYFESINDQKNTLTIKGNIGLVLLKLKDYPKAKKYIQEEIDFETKNASNEGLCVSCTNMGNVLLKMKDTVGALKYYEKALKACQAVGNNKGISTALSNIGSVKADQKKSKEALALYQKSLEVRHRLNSDLDEAVSQLKVAKEEVAQGKYKEAKFILKSVEPLFEKQQFKDHALQTYQLLAAVYAHENLGDSVIYYTEKYTDAKDEALENFTLKATNELEAKYQNEKKEKELLQQEIENRKKTTWLIILTLITLFIGLIGYLIYRQQRLKNTQQQQEFELRTAMAQIETQNQLHEQRLAISRDLHDNIGAQLTFIISTVENLKFGFPSVDEPLKKQLTKISDFSKQTIQELRDTIWAMNNDNFTMEELRSRLMNFLEKAQLAQDQVQLHFTIEPALNAVQLTSLEGINFYRSIQEAVNNALKYAAAHTIDVQAFYDEKGIHVRITDDGVGFSEETIVHGNGLYNMKKRMEEVGGTFTIQSEPKQGTQIQLTLNKSL